MRAKDKQTTEGTLNAISLFLGFLNPPKWLSDSSGWIPPVEKVADELRAAMPFFEGNADVLAVLKQLNLDLGALMLKLAINTPEIRKRVVSVEVPAFVEKYQSKIAQLIAGKKEHFLTIPVAVKMFVVSRRTIFRLIKEGKLKNHKEGSKCLVDSLYIGAHYPFRK